MPPIYSKRVLCFPVSSNSTEHKDYIVQSLFTALQYTVEELPFLAGSVVPFSNEQPWLNDLRAQGAAYLEVKDFSQEIKFEDLRKARFSSSILDTEKLCPFPKAIYRQDDPIDVCRLRANFVDGGLLLVISVIHVVCDGRGISDVLKIFADKLRKLQETELAGTSNGHKGTSEKPYTFDRASVLSGKGVPGTIENHKAWTVLPLAVQDSYTHSKTLCTTFHISSDSLRSLKRVASSPDQSTSISTHDSITALIWRSIMLARHRAGIISEQTITRCGTFVDSRSRLDLPSPYFGNAIYSVFASVAFPALESSTNSIDTSPLSGLQAAALAIRADINDATGEKVRDLFGFIDRTSLKHPTRLTLLDDLSVSSIIITSYFGFEMHELDFGEALGGRMEAFRLPSEGLVPGVPVILPRLSDGRCEFVISETEDVGKFLLEDEIFRRFASKLC